MPSLIQEGGDGHVLSELFTSRIFWVLMLLMAAAGASEQGVSQWASTFAEQGLGVSKTMGDLAGPMFFAVMMGLSRLFYGKYGDRIRLDRFMIGSSVLCAASYLCVALAPVPVLGLVGCGFCDFPWESCGREASARERRLCPEAAQRCLPFSPWRGIWAVPAAPRR